MLILLAFATLACTIYYTAQRIKGNRSKALTYCTLAAIGNVALATLHTLFAGALMLGGSPSVFGNLHTNLLCAAIWSFSSFIGFSNLARIRDTQ
jgi:hypothetical protein